MSSSRQNKYYLMQTFQAGSVSKPAAKKESSSDDDSSDESDSDDDEKSVVKVSTYIFSDNINVFIKCGTNSEVIIKTYFFLKP